MIGITKEYKHKYISTYSFFISISISLSFRLRFNRVVARQAEHPGCFGSSSSRHPDVSVRVPLPRHR